MKTHKNKFLIIALCSSAMLSACKEENRPNPVLSKPNGEVLQWLYKNKTTKIEVCSKHWSDPKTASKVDLNYCKATAKKIADEMNYQGFLQDVRENDLNLPIIWREFYNRILSDAEHKDRIKKEAEEMKNKPQGLFGNFPRNTKW